MMHTIFLQSDTTATIFIAAHFVCGYYMYSRAATKCIQGRLLPYSGKFSNGANFRIFRMLALYSKIKTAKI